MFSVCSQVHSPLPSSLPSSPGDLYGRINSLLARWPPARFGQWEDLRREVEGEWGRVCTPPALFLLVDCKCSVTLNDGHSSSQVTLSTFLLPPSPGTTPSLVLVFQGPPTIPPCSVHSFSLLLDPLGSQSRHLLVAIPNERKSIFLSHWAVWNTLGPSRSAQAPKPSPLTLLLGSGAQESVPADSCSLLSVNKSAPAAGALMEARQWLITEAAVTWPPVTQTHFVFNRAFSWKKKLKKPMLCLTQTPGTQWVKKH